MSFRWRSSEIVGGPAGEHRYEIETRGKERVVHLRCKDALRAVFTPALAEAFSFDAERERWMREGTTSSYQNGRTLTVGEGRWNLIVVNGTIVNVIHGPVQVPPIGIVVSLHDELYGLICRGAGEAFAQMKPPFYGQVRLDDAPGTPPMAWYFGGFNMLVEDGVNLTATREEAEMNYRREGWDNFLSMRTQETQVQDWVRGPRSIFGETMADEAFLATCSGGRSPGGYRGVTHAEAVELIQEQLARMGTSIKHALNVDGGSSSCLSMWDAQHKLAVALNEPEIGDNNRRGMPRAVAGLILFQL